MLFLPFTEQVIKRLQLKYGAKYQLNNVAISGTHTHGAPGGFNEYAMYDTPNLGFVKETFHALVSGIYDVSSIYQSKLHFGTLFLLDE